MSYTYYAVIMVRLMNWVTEFIAMVMMKLKQWLRLPMKRS